MFGNRNCFSFLSNTPSSKALLINVFSDCRYSGKGFFFNFIYKCCYLRGDDLLPLSNLFFILDHYTSSFVG